jgi:flagellar motor switch protein FliN/FliY
MTDNQFDDQFVEVPQQEPQASVAQSQPEQPAAPAPPAGVPNADANDDAMMEMLNNLPNEEQKVTPQTNDSALKVSRAEFQQLSQPSEQGQPSNLDLLMDINLPVSIELGRTRMPIAELLALGPGSVVELNKLAGEPVDVMVNQKLVARGEVVVIDENFGVRITQLMTPEERLKLLGEDV